MKVYEMGEGTVR